MAYGLRPQRRPQGGHRERTETLLFLRLVLYGLEAVKKGFRP